MSIRFVVHLVGLAVAFAFTASVIPGFEIEGGVLTMLWVALVFGLVNGILGPLLRLVSLPLTVVTLGLFSLVVNGVLLAVVAGLTDSFDVGSFGWTTVGALLLGVVAAALDFLLDSVVPQPEEQRLRDGAAPQNS